MWRRFAGWMGRAFGATTDASNPLDLVTVFEGHPTACEAVALRLQASGMLVSPDPRPRFSGLGRANDYRPGGSRNYAGVIRRPSTTVAVLAADQKQAEEILASAQPI